MNDITLIAGTAAYIGFLHTLLGPDHYLPFIVMRKARKWSMTRTLTITFLCGLGHVLSSVILGFIGLALGIMIGKLEAFEAFRGNLAAQALIIFGFTYCIWGIHRALRNKPHKHLHMHDGMVEHSHDDEEALTHPQRNITPWVLFTVFVLGPCEPLIPIIMYPAYEHSLAGVFAVTGIFALVTIGTMMSVVLISSWGLGFIRLQAVERFSHALAGAAICCSGLAIQLLGL